MTKQMSRRQFPLVCKLYFLAPYWFVGSLVYGTSYRTQVLHCHPKILLRDKYQFLVLYALETLLQWLRNFCIALVCASLGSACELCIAWLTLNRSCCRVGCICDTNIDLVLLVLLRLTLVWFLPMNNNGVIFWKFLGIFLEVETALDFLLGIQHPYECCFWSWLAYCVHNDQLGPWWCL